EAGAWRRLRDELAKRVVGVAGLIRGARLVRRTGRTGGDAGCVAVRRHRRGLLAVGVVAVARDRDGGTVGALAGDGEDVAVVVVAIDGQLIRRPAGRARRRRGNARQPPGNVVSVRGRLVDIRGATGRRGRRD